MRFNKDEELELSPELAMQATPELPNPALERKKALMDYLRSKNEPDFGTEQSLIDEAAQGDRESQLSGNIGRSLNQIIGALGRTKLDNTMYDEMAKTDKAEKIRNYLKEKRDFDLNKSKTDKELAMLNETLRHNRAVEGMDQSKIDIEKKKLIENPPLSPGEKKTDEEAAKTYADWNAAGGYEGMRANIDILKQVKQKLEEDPEAGPSKSYLMGGDRAQALMDPKGAQLNQAVTSAMQPMVKPLFPGAVSDFEQKSVIKTAYDPSLSAKANIEKLGSKIKELESRADAKNTAMKYFEGNKKSLKGFESAAANPAPEVSAPSAPQASAPTSPQNNSGMKYSDPDKEKRYQEWKAKQGLK